MKVLITMTDLAKFNPDDVLDNIEDLPSFVQPPTGSYRLFSEKGFEFVDEGDECFYRITFTCLEILEVKDELDVARGQVMFNVNDVCSQRWDMNHPMGRGSFKAAIKCVAEKYGLDPKTTPTSMMVEQSKGLEYLGVMKSTWNKDKQKYYSKIDQIAVL
jgi:hypothetical protein